MNVAFDEYLWNTKARRRYESNRTNERVENDLWRDTTQREVSVQVKAPVSNDEKNYPADVKGGGKGERARHQSIYGYVKYIVQKNS